MSEISLAVSKYKCQKHMWHHHNLLPCPDCSSADRVVVPVPATIGWVGYGKPNVPITKPVQNEVYGLACATYNTKIGLLRAMFWHREGTRAIAPTMPEWIRHRLVCKCEPCPGRCLGTVPNAYMCGWCGRSALEKLQWERRSPAVKAVEKQKLLVHPDTLAAYEKQFNRRPTSSASGHAAADSMRTTRRAVMKTMQERCRGFSREILVALLDKAVADNETLRSILRVEHHDCAYDECSTNPAPCPFGMAKNRNREP